MSEITDATADNATLARQMQAVAEARNWSMAEVSRRSGVAQGTLHEWARGGYRGRVAAINERIRLWLDTVEEMERVAASVPQAPGYIELGFAKSVVATLQVAQVMPAMVMITAGAGNGKTTAAAHYVQTRANAHLVTMSPHCRSPHNMLHEIGKALSVATNNSRMLVGAIGERLRRVGDGTLMVVDEAQNLSDDAINQLRHFVDIYGAGVALLGNGETYSRFTAWGQGEQYAQLRRRIFRRVRRDRPSPADLSQFLDAWGIQDAAQREFLTGVGLKPGALGQIDMTLKLARMTAEGAGREMRLADLQAAWSNRDVELV